MFIVDDHLAITEEGVSCLFTRPLLPKRGRRKSPGASLDLTQHKLLPSLVGLFRRHLFPDNFFILDCTRWRRIIIEKPFGHDLQIALA